MLLLTTVTTWKSTSKESFITPGNNSPKRRETLWNRGDAIDFLSLGIANSSQIALLHSTTQKVHAHHQVGRMRSITSFCTHLRSCRGQHNWKYLCSLTVTQFLFICFFKIFFPPSSHFCKKITISLPVYYFYSNPPQIFIPTISFSISWSIFILYG